MRDNILDKWIEARLKSLILEVSGVMDSYELDKAVRSVGDFVDDFSNWYIRRSRERFKKEGEEKNKAVNIARFVLIEFSKLIAPFMPFIAEEIYQSVKDVGEESVHLEDWPKTERITNDELRIIKDMKKAREDVSIGLDLRLKAGIKVRQPLSFFETPNKFNNDYIALIKDELNVKEVKVGKEYKLDTKITEELKKEGMLRDLTRTIQDLRKKAGLAPRDKIELIVETDKKGEEFVNKFMKEIKSGTNTASIKFSENNGQEIKIGDLVFKIKI